MNLRSQIKAEKLRDVLGVARLEFCFPKQQKWGHDMCKAMLESKPYGVTFSDSLLNSCTSLASDVSLHVLKVVTTFNIRYIYEL